MNIRLWTICAIILLLGISLPGQVPAPPDTNALEQELKAITVLETDQPQAVGERLNPFIAALRGMREAGTLTLESSRIYKDALLLLMRNQAMLMAPEEEVAGSLKEMLTLDPKTDEGVFNPREKLLVEKIRSAETGYLSLQTTPPGAELYYHGMDFGITPLETALIAGTYRFRLRMRGYRDQDFEAAIKPSEILTVVLPLRRSTVEVPISLNAAGATISLNGKTMGTSAGYESWIASLTPEQQPSLAAVVKQEGVDVKKASFFLLKEIPIGEATTIEIHAPCYENRSIPVFVEEQEVDWSRSFFVRRDLTRIELKRDTGFMQVSSDPSGAEVRLDGTLEGKTPLGMDVCVGTHRVQVLHASGQYARDVIIRRGQATKVAGDLRPALAFLGVYTRNAKGDGMEAVARDWEKVAQRLVLRSTAFSDPMLLADDLERLRRKGSLPVEQLLEREPSAAESDLAVRSIAEATGQVDLLLVGVRSEGRYFFRLYNAIHRHPDLIEVPDLEEPALDFIIGELNKAERVQRRILVADLDLDFMESTRGLAILKGSQPAAAPASLEGATVRAIDQKPMSFNELSDYLREAKSGQSMTLELELSNKNIFTASFPVRFRGTEYPWSSPDGFTGSVLVMLRHLIERDPLGDESKFASLSLARGLMKAGEWKLALEYLAKTNLEPHKTGICPGTVLYYQGRCYEALGDRAQAESYYNRARDFQEATLGMPDGLPVASAAERRLRLLGSAER